MLGIGLSLTDWRGVDFLARYLANGIRPVGALDFVRRTFIGVDGLTTDVSDIATISTPSNRTVVDSDGQLKWTAHNLETQSQTLAGYDANAGNASVDVGEADPDGGATGGIMTCISGNAVAFGVVFSTANTKTFSVWLKAGTQDSPQIQIGAASAGQGVRATADLTTGTIGAATLIGGSYTAVSSGIEAAGDGWYRCWVSAVTPATNHVGYIRFGGDGTTVAFAWPHIYRSDLGGMAPVPVDQRIAGSETYVPTTDAAVYLPRENSHVYEDGAWVNKGLLIESEARTNLVENSNGFDEASWSLFDGGDTLTSTFAASPDGGTNAWLFAPDNTSGLHILRNPHTFSASTTYTISVFLKASGRRYAHLALGGASLDLPSYDHRRGVFDLQDGAIHAAPTNGLAQIVGLGGGWYRCSATVTTGPSGVFSDYIANLDISHANTSTPTSSSFADGNGTDGFLVYGAQLE